MVLTWLQKLYPVPWQVVVWLGCGTDVHDIDGRSISSTSTAYDQHEKALPQLPKDKQSSLPYYLRWPDSHFAISEYNWNEDHFIDLNNLPIQDRLVARALSEFRNTRPDYADPEIPYENSFDLERVFETLRELVTEAPDFQWTKRDYYVVAYYSTLRSDLGPEDRKKLAELDEAAFREALPSKAFVKYWFGRPDQYGRNLATCLWTNRNDARRTLANGPYHRRAAKEGQGLYQKGSIDIREYSLTIDQDIKDWSLELLSRRIHA